VEQDCSSSKCPHCGWNHPTTAKCCNRCGLSGEAPVVHRADTSTPQITALGLLMLLGAVGGPFFLELPIGYLFGAGMGASGIVLTILGGAGR
jgi:hypothetical protein